MFTFPQLIKAIRKESGLTQKELADALAVSTILISMIEAGQKDVSKNFILKLADKMDVHPSTITPFLFADKKLKNSKITLIEKELIKLGEALQEQLIIKRSKQLRRDYASGERTLSST